MGRFRRTWLSPMPVVDDLAELNERCRRWDDIDDQRRIGSRLRTVAADFALEQPLLQALSVETFDPGLVLNPRVDRSALVTVRMARYSVPARLIGRRVRVSLRASEVRIFDGRTLVAQHPRVIARGGESVNLDHYLEVLQTKPGALPGSTALAHARAAGTFTAAHEAFWAAARKTDGDAAGTRQLIDILLLHRTMTTTDIVAGLTAALQVGAVTADVVAVEARCHAALHGAEGGSESDRRLLDRATIVDRRVVSQTQRRLADPAAVIAGLPADTRPLPSLAGYDDLLTLHQGRTNHETPTEATSSKGTA